MLLKRTLTTISGFTALAVTAALTLAPNAEARDMTYTGGEQKVFVSPGEPTQINFPGQIGGGFKRKNSTVMLEKQDNYLVVFAQGQLPVDGEAILVHLADKRSYALRILPATSPDQKDVSVSIIDPREPEIDVEEPQNAAAQQPGGDIRFAPPSTISGLMREMILVAEFGKKRQIPGYHRSNRYTGETVLQDGAVEAKIDEIFMGSNYWGYVLNVENALDTTQRLNPATFRLDGTRAVVAERWELSPRPMTAEQKISGAHKGRVYIVTIAKRK